MKVPFEAKCSKCNNNMVMADTSEYDDTFYCETCKYTVEVKPRTERCDYNWLKQKESDIKENWSVGKYNGSAHEYYKGQFLLIREMLNPSYRKSEAERKEELRQTGLLEDEAKRRHDLPWIQQKQSCGNCKETMVENHGSNDDKELIHGVRCPRCDSEVQITIPHEKPKTPLWKKEEIKNE